VAPLVGQFNAVLAEQRRNLQRARSLAGNLAHAMKTPLTVIANAAQDPRIEGQQLRETVQHYGALAEKQVAWHLKRARMAASTTGHYTPVRVAEVLRGLITVLHRAHPEKSVEVLCDVPLTLRFLGEREDLQEILGNLLDNAFKWARASVAVSVVQSEGRIFLLLDDDGPGVPAARYGEILQRGTRLDEVVPGSGLGLAIVAELVALYNGSIAFSESAQGGLRVQLALPMAHG
jgi:signal transduction histidine kinase